ncbi:AraC family transcriptional regulator [Niallia sp. 03133]|uniref:AraC family transcriptional regulator n=1 Tax=Niallia sp. 03133 TaxID=3458060 RepID=UPI004044A905
MSKLEVKENKKLVLKNVIINELRSIQIEKLDAEIQKFINLTQILHMQTFGPLITKLVGTNLHDDGSLTFDYDLIVQAHNYHLHKEQFKVKKEYSCRNCIYLRYEGKAEHLNFAHSKLDLHIFENDLLTNGEMYSVFLSNTPEKMVVDIFRPVTRNETL